jgi:hypothetical protein
MYNTARVHCAGASLCTHKSRSYRFFLLVGRLSVIVAYLLATAYGTHSGFVHGRAHTAQVQASFMASLGVCSLYTHNSYKRLINHI